MVEFLALIMVVWRKRVVADGEEEERYKEPQKGG